MLFGARNIIGFDLGNSAIKAIELKVSPRSSTLVGLSMVPTPPNSLNSGEILQVEPLAMAVKEAYQALNTKNRSVAVGLWGSSVFVKKINGVPHIKGKIVPEQVRFEVEQLNPFGSMDLIHFDYHTYPMRSQSSEGLDVLVGIAQKDALFKYVELFTMADLQCDILDISALAAANCFEFNYKDQIQNETVIVFDIGAEISHFLVLRGTTTVLSRSLQFGVSSYVQEIERSMSISPVEAQSLLVAAGKGQETPPELMSIINSGHDSLLENLRAGLDFYYQTESESKPERIFITGGGSLIPGFFEKLNEMIGVPCERLNPFLKIASGNKFSDAQLSAYAPFSAVAVGLGLRGGFKS